MAVRIVRLGTPRVAGEGLRLGTVRRVPRGVKKGDYAKLDYFDLWFPELAPSDELFRFAMAKPWTSQRWSAYSKRYKSEMAKAPAKRILDVLAALSREANFSVGCYCEDENRCHRSLLKALLKEHGARIQ